MVPEEEFPSSWACLFTHYNWIIQPITHTAHLTLAGWESPVPAVIAWRWGTSRTSHQFITGLIWGREMSTFTCNLQTWMNLTVTWHVFELLKEKWVCKPCRHRQNMSTSRRKTLEQSPGPSCCKAKALNTALNTTLNFLFPCYILIIIIIIISSVWSPYPVSYVKTP